MVKMALAVASRRDNDPGGCMNRRSNALGVSGRRNMTLTVPEKKRQKVLAVCGRRDNSVGSAQKAEMALIVPERRDSRKTRWKEQCKVSVRVL